MDPTAPGRTRPDRSAAHRALQEALRAPDTFRSARAAAARGGALKRLLAPLAARVVHFFADRQVEWNAAAARALEAATRAIDDGDAWVETIAAELREVESRVRGLESELRAAREAEAEARRKLAVAGLRLRDLEQEQRELARRLGGRAS